jgi:hypothetical protein
VIARGEDEGVNTMPGTKRLLALIVAALLLLTPAVVAQGAPGGGGGPPDGVGNRPDGVGGGKPDNAGSKKGDIYADLMVIARNLNGTPITVEYEVEGEEGTETHVCVRPITRTLNADPVLASYPDAYPTFGYDEFGVVVPMYFVPLVGNDAVVLDLEPCDVYPGESADETDLGRLNLGRAPERVLGKHLRTVSDWLDVGDGVSIGLDASGRFTQLDADGNVLDTVDSPLENLAAMQSILETGSVPAAGGLPTVKLSPLELAAVQLGAAAPKEDGFEQMVDVVQYLGRILSIPKDTEWAEVMPVLTGTNYLRPDEFETFLDFESMPTYSRSEMFPGCIHWYDLDGEHAGTLMSFVFGGHDAGADGLEGYTQLAADAREVLVTVHDLGMTVLGVDDIHTYSGEVLCSISEQG